MTVAEHGLVGNSLGLRRVRELIRAVAPTRIPVLIHGETGSGKELVARALHQASGRRGNLVAFNVCAISDSMFEDSLFGHTRGAFTGATSDSIGLLREAAAGSAFLDEVSGLPMSLQAKLLRVIETGVVRPVGGARDVQVDFRVLSATNENLGTLVDAGRFRADLEHRLSGVVIEVPPLRERVEDIPTLVAHFLAAFAPSTSFVVRPSVVDRMMLHEWRGNIRELRQVVEAAAVFGGNVIDDDSYSIAVANRQSRSGAAFAVTPRAKLLDALTSCDWDTRLVAESLGVHRATVYRWMRRFAVSAPNPALR